MRLICVGGLSSGSGKTSVVCLLLKALPGWAAIKVTPSRPDDVCPRGEQCEACRQPEGDFEITVDDEIPKLPGKDTGRFFDAGASHVAFVRALPENIPAALDAAIDRLGDVPGVVIESTTAMPHIDGLRVLVARDGVNEIKDSARKALELADTLVINREIDDAGSAACDFPLTADKPCVTVCAALGPDHPRNRQFIGWVRGRTLSFRAESRNLL